MSFGTLDEENIAEQALNTKMQTIKKYSFLFLSFFRASIMADLEYRMNIALKFFNDLIWYSVQLSVFEALFAYTKSVSGWTLHDTRMFMAVLFVTDSIYMILFSENLDKLSDRVRKGDIDMLLTKPANAQFILSFQKMNTAYLLNFCLTLSWLTFSCSNLTGGITLSRVLTLLIMIPCAVALTYSTRFFFSASALILTRADSLNYMWFNLYKLGTRPDSIYPNWLRYILLTIVPVAFFASVPTRIIMGSASHWFIALGIGVAGFFVYSTILFWRYALKFYSSASS